MSSITNQIRRKLVGLGAAVEVDAAAIGRRKVELTRHVSPKPNRPKSAHFPPRPSVALEQERDASLLQISTHLLPRPLVQRNHRRGDGVGQGDAVLGHLKRLRPQPRDEYAVEPEEEAHVVETGVRLGVVVGGRDAQADLSVHLPILWYVLHLQRGRQPLFPCSA